MQFVVDKATKSEMKQTSQSNSPSRRLQPTKWAEAQNIKLNCSEAVASYAFTY